MSKTNNTRRNFFMFAGAGALTSLLGKSGSIFKPQSTVDEFLTKSELSTQIDLVIDSVVKRNPKHIELSVAELEALKAEGRAELSSLYRELVAREFTQEDLGEMVQHFTNPAEKKWTKFHKLAISEARSVLTAKLENILKNGKGSV